MSALFPNRRYVVTGGGRHHEPADADAEAREMSRHVPTIVRVEVIEEAEPVGAMLFKGGRLITTERDAR